MKIISKRQAMALYRQHPESRLFRFCSGKYAWSGSICHYAGKEVQNISGVWPCSLNVDRTATARMSYCAVLP